MIKCYSKSTNLCIEEYAKIFTKKQQPTPTSPTIQNLRFVLSLLFH